MEQPTRDAVQAIGYGTRGATRQWRRTIPTLIWLTAGCSQAQSADDTQKFPVSGASERLSSHEHCNVGVVPYSVALVFRQAGGYFLRRITVPFRRNNNSPQNSHGLQPSGNPLSYCVIDRCNEIINTQINNRNTAWCLPLNGVMLLSIVCVRPHGRTPQNVIANKRLYLEAPNFGTHSPADTLCLPMISQIVDLHFQGQIF